jgi:type I restriction enzyme S subunit
VSGTWPARRLKYLVAINAHSLPEDTPPDFEFRYLDIGAVGRGALVAEPEVTMFGDAPSRARRLVVARDTIVSTVRTYLRAVWPVSGDTSDLVVSTGFAVLTPGPAVDARFLGWAAQSNVVIEEIVARSVGVSYPAINGLEIGDIPVPLPSLPRQRAIADYLDAETARLDRSVAAIHRSLELLTERRKSLIVAAFSRAGDGSRGTTVRAIADPLLGRQRSPDQATGPHMVPYLRAANVKDGRLDLSDVMEMNFSPAEQRRFALVPGDVLITEGAGSLAAVGANAVWSVELDGVICFQNTLVRLRPKPGSDPRFVAWWARYAYESGLLGAVAGGANIYHLGVETVRTLPAWTPPLEVQSRVADQLDWEVASLQRQAAIRERQIKLLLERRQALITAAVTGQLEIPAVAA